VVDNHTAQEHIKPARQLGGVLGVGRVPRQASPPNQMPTSAMPLRMMAQHDSYSGRHLAASIRAHFFVIAA
jgi:hypothetical protein